MIFLRRCWANFSLFKFNSVWKFHPQGGVCKWCSSELSQIYFIVSRHICREILKARNLRSNLASNSKRWSHVFLWRKFVGLLDHNITFHYLYASFQSAQHLKRNRWSCRCKRRTMKRVSDEWNMHEWLYRNFTSKTIVCSGKKSVTQVKGRRKA